MVLSARPAGSRLRFAASLAIGLALFMALAAVAASRALADDTSDADVAKTISRELANLNVPPRTIELSSEKAARVRNAIKNGDYATARQITATIQAESHVQYWRYYPFDTFISRVSDLRDPRYGQRLDDWVMQDKDDPIPLLIRAQYYHDIGWTTRGEKFSRETPEARMTSFATYMAKGIADVDNSMRLDTSNPYTTFLKLLLLRGLGMGPQIESAFEEGMNRFPDYYAQYRLMLNVLEPKWGGSTDAMYAFVDTYASHTPDNSPLRMLYLALYRHLLDAAGVDCYQYSQDRDKAGQCVEADMKLLIRPELERQVIATFALYDHTDRAQFADELKPILFGMLGSTGGDAHSGTILQLAANAMHSDTQLAEAGLGHNNFVIDQAVAESWYRKGSYDNALRKDMEALHDVQSTEFPNEEERLIETGSIYDHIAHIYPWFGHNPEIMIAYEKAAVALSGESADALPICRGYYALRDYDNAIQECAKVVNSFASGLSAQYWRGLAYEQVDQADAALADLAAVADSELEYRNSAAIEMSLIYFNRQDWANEVDLLNKYGFLYDPKINDKAGIALAYYNRCQAYMQLGELKKALDDCTQSLKFGSLPDAYRKQQELIKRLSPRQRGL